MYNLLNVQCTQEQAVNHLLLLITSKGKRSEREIKDFIVLHYLHIVYIVFLISINTLRRNKDNKKLTN